MKRALLAFSVVALLTTPAAAAPHRITYIAHRGGALEVPENSTEGLRAALDRGTAQVLDFDTRLLGDGTPVVIHDATLDRTTDKTGPVRDLDIADWSQVRILPDADRGPGWVPERPPTVAEVLDEFGGRITLTMEAKDPASLPALATLIKERGLTGTVYVNTNSPDLARKIHRAGLLTQLWRSAAQMRGDRPERWRGVVDAFDVDYRARDSDLRRYVAAGAREVWAHTITTRAQRDRVVRLGCDGVVTDAPGLLAQG
ncbi:MAG: glycerophosphoryl diester phosphodiesterase [Streptomyces sp.]|nr:glycerophosphoryl diester phosphodiesterase [Streptomyces sp.]